MDKFATSEKKVVAAKPKLMVAWKIMQAENRVLVNIIVQRIQLGHFCNIIKEVADVLWF